MDSFVKYGRPRARLREPEPYATVSKGMTKHVFFVEHGRSLRLCTAWYNTMHDARISLR
jgi:hypothetical protein